VLVTPKAAPRRMRIAALAYGSLRGFAETLCCRCYVLLPKHRRRSRKRDWARTPSCEGLFATAVGIFFSHWVACSKDRIQVRAGAAALYGENSAAARRSSLGILNTEHHLRLFRWVAPTAPCPV
jgi:hypothetical protein